MSAKVIRVSKAMKQSVETHSIEETENDNMLEVSNMLEAVFFNKGSYSSVKAVQLRPIFFDVLTRNASHLFGNDIRHYNYFMGSLIQFLNKQKRYVGGNFCLSDDWILLGAKLLKGFGNLLLQKSRST